MGPPGGGRNDVSARMMSHLNIIGIDAFSDDILGGIFSAITDKFFGKAGCDVSFGKHGRVMVQATLDIYKQAMLNFLPTHSVSKSKKTDK